MSIQRYIGIILICSGIVLWVQLPGNWIAFAPVIVILGVLAMVLKN